MVWLRVLWTVDHVDHVDHVDSVDVVDVFQLIIVNSIAIFQLMIFLDCHLFIQQRLAIKEAAG